MTLTDAEKQQVEAAVNGFLESASMQATINNLITTAETSAVNFVENVINNAKIGGLLGGIFNALKGSADAEITAFVAQLPPAAIAAMATTAAENELKTLLGG